MSGDRRADLLRCQLDDVLALTIEAHRMVGTVISRMAQRARTVAEADDVVSLFEVRGKLYEIQEAARSKR